MLYELLAQNLYKKQDHDTNLIYDFVEDIELPRLSEVEKSSIEGALTVEECGVALKGMKNESSPGSDGLGAAFYKMFWQKIKHLVTDSLNYAFSESGTLSVSQRKAIVTLMHKGKDLPRDRITNYRPLSLTNVDYKIGAKSLATRLQSVISSVVHTDQTAYIKGRGVTDNIRLIDDVLWYTREHNLDGILLALDFAKAFDSLDREYILKAFELFNFGDDFLRWLKVFGSDTTSSILYNGWLTEFFKVERGIRQGCPLSALLFIVALELLSCKIRNQENIKGINVKNGTESRNVLITQFADDMTLFRDGLNSFNNSVHIIELFGNICGLRLNRTKSEAMWIGQSRNSTHAIGNVKLLIGPKSLIRILGVHFSSHHEASLIKINWSSKIDRMKKIVLSWRQRKLTLLGKICLIKSLIASQVLYLLTALTLPGEVLQELKTIFFKFLWKTTERVKRTALMQSYDTGGLKMLDIEVFRKKMLCNIIKKITTCEFDTCSVFVAKGILNGIVPDLLLLKFNTKLENVSNHIPLISNLPVYYQSLLKAWYDCKLDNNHLQSNDVVWLNDLIKYKGKPLFFERWIKKGIIYVEDVTADNVLLSQHDLLVLAGQSPDFVLKYHLIKCVFKNQSWVNTGKTARAAELEINRCMVKICNNNAFVRWLLGDNISINDVKERFWNNKFDVVIDWSYTWSLPFKLKLDAKCCELHWKIVHNIYPTRILLEKMGLANNNKCQHCQQVEFIDHFFATCTAIRPLWAHVESVFNALHGQRVHLSVKDMLLGYEHANWVKFVVLNKMIVVAKLSVSKYKYGDHPNLLLLFDRECRLRKIGLPQ